MYIHIYIYIGCNYKQISFIKYLITKVVPCKKNKRGLLNAQVRCNVNSELCIRLPLLFYTWVPSWRRARLVQGAADWASWGTAAAATVVFDS